jgi:hypothetical protein
MRPALKAGDIGGSDGGGSARRWEKIAAPRAWAIGDSGGRRGHRATRGMGRAGSLLIAGECCWR